MINTLARRASPAIVGRMIRLLAVLVLVCALAGCGDTSGPCNYSDQYSPCGRAHGRVPGWAAAVNSPPSAPRYSHGRIRPERGHWGGAPPKTERYSVAPAGQRQQVPPLPSDPLVGSRRKARR